MHKYTHSCFFICPLDGTPFSLGTAARSIFLSSNFNSRHMSAQN